MRGFWKFLMMVPVSLVLSSGGMARADDDTAKMLEHIRANQCSGLEEKLTPLALAGNANAEFNLGEIYNRGCDVTRDVNRATAWFGKAAAHGRSDAYSIGLLYATGTNVQKNDVEAVKWFRRGANQGDALAQLQLALYYEEGKGGLERDYFKTMYWARKAADQGLAAAQTAVGYLYDKGLGVPADREQALRWFRKAAAQNDMYAQNNIGVSYENGYAVPKDYTEALKWYGLAAAQGYDPAQQNIDNLKAKMSGRHATPTPYIPSHYTTEPQSPEIGSPEWMRTPEGMDTINTNR